MQVWISVLTTFVAGGVSVTATVMIISSSKYPHDKQGSAYGCWRWVRRSRWTRVMPNAKPVRRVKNKHAHLQTG